MRWTSATLFFSLFVCADWFDVSYILRILFVCDLSSYIPVNATLLHNSQNYFPGMYAMAQLYAGTISKVCRVNFSIYTNMHSVISYALIMA